MSVPETPVIKPRRQLLVWIVPLLALAIGGYLVQREFATHGPRITIRFEDGEGITPNQTHLIYKGLPMGVVSDVALLPDFSGIELTIELNRSAAPLARDGSRFWIVRPEITAAGVKGLDTILSGPTIAVLPGTGGPALNFTGLESAPPDNSSAGTEFTLHASRRGSLQRGQIILYREVSVGRILDVFLAPDATHVVVQARIDAPYDRLVRANSVFWNASGVDVDIGLFRGAKIRTNSLSSLLSGGIAFATPEEPAPTAAAGTVFPLNDRAEDRWFKWTPAIPLGEGPRPHDIKPMPSENAANSASSAAR
ncbi:intermembrane transport protein PqiB [Rariglobus hedericola]|uniref:MCE family protein n=1 Tax=Rariglobus hedericola TaxID=2597822 RepID=A0A556QJ52_9BACT|nr:MlaD family protein [Rariglobus hedericola]TSJ76683.1 MCE family protein [Rariglobus hedericola]